MRIALVTTSWPESEDDAAGHFVRTEARALGDEGHEVTVLSPSCGGAFGWPGVLSRVRARPWRIVEVARWVRATRRKIAAGRFDRVVAHWALPSAWPIAVAASVPLEVVSHGSDVRLLVRLPAAARSAIVRKICDRAVAWRFVSLALQDELLGALSTKDARAVREIALISPCAITMPDVRDAASQRRAANGKRRVAVSVARLIRAKRIDAVIDHVARTHPETLLVVVGDGPDRARLEEHARARRIEARFVGKIDRKDALTWIASADVVVHASRAEGLSTVLREAAILGVPVEHV